MSPVAVAYPRVTPRSQFDDPTTTQDGLNCTSTAFVMLGELATGLRLYPGQFRAYQSDHEGGISIPDGGRAWAKAYPDARLDWAAPNDGTPIPPTRHGDRLTEDQAWALVEFGHGLVWQGLNSVLSDAGVSPQPSFSGPHALYVDGVRTVLRRQAYVIDPLGRDDYDGQWIEWSVLVKYGEALGQGGIYAAWSSPSLPDTSTEVEPMPGPTYRPVAAVTGYVIVTGPDHAAIQLDDGTRVPLPDRSRKDVYARIQFVPALDKASGDRVNAFLIGDEAAALLASDVDATNVRAVDTQHKVGMTVDGKLKTEVLV